MSAKRLPLPVRRSMAVTDAAYARLRALNERYGLGNNYLLVVLLERLGDFADPDRLDARAMWAAIDRVLDEVTG